MLNDPNGATGEAVSAASLRHIIADAEGDMHKVYDFALLVHERLTENRPISLEVANAMSWLSCELVTLGKRMSETHEALHKAVIAVPDACPMVALVAEYRTADAAYEAVKGELADEAAQALYDRTIEPVRSRMFEAAPAIQSDKGAAEAVRVVLECGDISGVELSLLQAVQAYLDGRAAR